MTCMHSFWNKKAIEDFVTYATLHHYTFVYLYISLSSIVFAICFHLQMCKVLACAPFVLHRVVTERSIQWGQGRKKVLCVVLYFFLGVFVFITCPSSYIPSIPILVTDWIMMCNSERLTRTGKQKGRRQKTWSVNFLHVYFYINVLCVYVLRFHCIYNL